VIEFWRKLWELTRPYKARAFLGVFFSVLRGAADAAVLLTIACVALVSFADKSSAAAAARLPFTMPSWAAALYARAAEWAATHSFSKAALICFVGVVPLAMLARGVVNYLSSYLMNWVGVRAICGLRARLFEHLLNQPVGFLARNSTGELMSRISTDVGLLQNMLGVSMVTMISEPINVVVWLYIPWTIDPWYTLIAMVALPVCVIPITIYNRKVRRSAAAIQSETAGLNRVIHEAFTGIRIIKGYNLEKIVGERFRDSQKKFINQSMRVVRSTESPGPIIEVLAAVGVAILLLVVPGHMTRNDFLVFVLALMATYRPIKAVIRLQSDLHRARAATARVFELLAAQSTIVDPPQPQRLNAARGDIHFDNISFSYGDKLALHDIQLRVRPGEVVALVGKSGAGKTTLTNLLLRFYDPTQGAIRIGGVDIRQAAVRDLRMQMAVVTQEIILFDDTIRNNIALGRPDATTADIEEAARHAFAHDFIMQKPLGYETRVGEKGVNLSGGQRQRIAIARALLRNAPILILDEAMSSLDNEAERLVQAALDELMKGRTTVCIAHRLSTIQYADRIVVLDEGRIVETGRHAELLARGGVYQKLHALGATLSAPPPEPPPNGGPATDGNGRIA
jgi:subfamily B ATP-binding cassette protein MsbA